MNDFAQRHHWIMAILRIPCQDVPPGKTQAQVIEERFQMAISGEGQEILKQAKIDYPQLFGDVQV